MEEKKKQKKKKDPEAIVREIKRRTRRKFSSEEKIRIVLEGLRGEDSIATICRREGINPNLYYRWSKAFLEGGKKRLSGDTQREATTDEVVVLRRENDDLKKMLGETYLKYEQFKKSQNGSF
jgi:transposase